MASYSAHLFGEFRVQRDGRAVEGLDANKARELLAYMLLFRKRTHTRDSLCVLLWSDATEVRARKSLRQALWQVQSVTRASARTGESTRDALLDVGAARVLVRADIELTVDVAVLESAAQSAEGINGRDLDTSTAQNLDQAQRLYRADLLEGWSQEWCLIERERLQALYISVLDKLIGYSDAHDSFEAGVAYAERILQVDHARERTHRQLMRLYLLAGDRTGAIRQYSRCAAALREELGVQPSRRTQALLDDIRADHLPARQPAVDPGVRNTLTRIRALAADLQAELTTAIGLLDHGSEIGDPR